MKQIIKLGVDIESTLPYPIDGNVEIRIVRMLFTDISVGLLDNSEIITSIKKAIKKIGGYKMITLTAMTYPDTFGAVTNPTILESYRYVNRTDKIEWSKLRNNKYASEPNTENGWLVCETAQIYSHAHSIVDLINRKFIELLQKGDTVKS